MPASFSACQVGEDEYNGKAGSPQLVATKNTDLQDETLRTHWDQVFTPHAALLAAPFRPTEFERALLAAETLGAHQKLYVKGQGWLDGLHVKGKDIGKVVPIFLTLDQEMIALLTSQMNSHKKMISGSEALFNNQEAHRRLTKYFQLLDKKLDPQI